jgi:bisphosphoglycerate-independent phosphoglycerate mutase (AlkP superfamily)
VPCWLITPGNRKSKPSSGPLNLATQGMLVDLAPTVLKALGIEKPERMIGTDLFQLAGGKFV